MEHIDMELPDSPFYCQLDRRTTVLETRFDTILPTLATKADLTELRADMKADIRTQCARLEAKLSMWLVGIVITLFLGFGSMFYAMANLLRH